MAAAVSAKVRIIHRRCCIASARATGIVIGRCFALKQTPDRIARPQDTNCPSVTVSQEFFVPEQEAIRRAERDKQEGKPPSTQAGEFVREEMAHVRQGVHGARSMKQAIAIGLSKARRAGVDLPPPGKKASSARSSKGTSSSNSSRKRAKSSSAHCVARVLLLPRPSRFPVSHKPTPASAVPQAVIAPPRKLRKPGLTIGRSGAANHQAGARLRLCRGAIS
jgi:hypothetical protein